MELTKEYFDGQLKLLNNRMDGFATKDDLANLPTKGDVDSLRTGLAGLESEVSSLKSTVDDIKETVQRIDQRDIEDSDAFAKDIVQLKKDVKHLKLKHA
jgi:hypothetical protein